MIKKASLMTALSVTAFSGWAQDSNSDTLVVTANRFQQPVNTVLAPTDIVTRDDIDRWQSKDLNDVMRRLPGVDIARNGGMGQSASLYVRGTEARHVLVLIDGVPMARPGISNGVDISQIPISLVQRVEYIRGPRSAVYGADAIGGVVQIFTRRSAGEGLQHGADAHTQRHDPAPALQPGAQHGFAVDDQAADEDAWPDAVAVDQHAGEGNAGGGVERRHVARRDRQLQRQQPGEGVGDGESDEGPEGLA